MNNHITGMFAIGQKSWLQEYPHTCINAPIRAKSKCLKAMQSLTVLLFLTMLISSCSHTPTKPTDTKIPEIKKSRQSGSSAKININDACDIYGKKPEWLVASLATSQKWQVPLFVILAIIHQESRFVATARPLNPDKNSKKKYASSAYGYAQALDGTWKEYQQSTGNSSGRRNDFAAAADFIGWYTMKVHRVHGTSKWATDKIYLNYHEGLGGYKRGTHKRKPWLIKVAAKVKKRGSLYAQQFKSCGIPMYVKKGSQVPKIIKSSRNRTDVKPRKKKSSKSDWF